MDKVDIVLCGRQAIDGDTAQVGPQVAEKLGMPQVTYAEEILSIADGKATIRRRIESGVETVKAPMPPGCNSQRLGSRLPSAQCQTCDAVQICRKPL